MRLRIALASLVAVALIACGGGVYADKLAGPDRQSLTAALHGLQTDLAAAARDGYTDQDLAYERQQFATIAGAAEPLVVWQRPAFYHSEMSQVNDLRHRLAADRATIHQDAEAQLQETVARIQSAIRQDRQLGVADDQVQALQERVTNLKAEDDLTLAALRSRSEEAKLLESDVRAAGAAQEQENSEIQVAANALLVKVRSDVAQMHKLGSTALAGGRNDATVAAYENLDGRFPAWTDMNAQYEKLEHFGSLLKATDATALAFSVAGTQHYAAAIHKLLLANLAPKQIIVSFDAQRMWAYEKGKVKMTTLVTTGIRGVTTYGTDFGPMKVLFKSHPWKFHSPYPTWSYYWYPDTWVEWTVFFTNDESFHDAYWESDSELGPGSQYDPGTRSHGCIHLSYDLAEWLYYWAPVGAPVDVYPGDGKTVAEQLAEVTTDNHGNPLHPA